MDNITLEELAETKTQETEIIGMLKALIISTKAKQSAPRIAGTMAGLGCVLVYMAVGCLGREIGLKAVSDIINRAIASLPSNEEIEKMKDNS